MTTQEDWIAKLAARAAGGSGSRANPAMVPVVVDMTDPRAAMRAAGWGGVGAPEEAPGTGVGRGSRVAEAVQGDDWQERAVAKAKAAKRERKRTKE